MSTISAAGSGGYYPVQQSAPAQDDGLSAALREERERQPDLAEMMKDAREQIEQRKEQFKLPKNSRRYGDAAIMACSRLARARSPGEGDAASGYARRQIAQLRAAKRSDSDNAERIQAVINQLQKTVNRAGRKRRELSQERLEEKRQARLAREKRNREAKRLRHQLRSRQAMRILRESGYMREAAVDNRIQDQLQASRMELRQQLTGLTEQTQSTVDAAIQQYASAAAEPAPAPELNVEA